MDKAQRNTKCPTCCQSYGTKDSQRGSSNVTRWPLLLTCGHAFCEGCLTKRAKQETEAISCPACKASTVLKNGVASVRQLPLDVYLLGNLFLHKSRHSSSLIGLDFMKINPELLKKKNEVATKASKKKEHCGECCVREATCRCSKCQCSMCDACFHSVHRSSKILRKHQAVPLYEDQTLAPIPAACAMHDNRPYEYYCQECVTPICSACAIMGNHQNHDIIPMEQKNKDAIEEIPVATESSQNVLRYLRKSDGLLSSLHSEVRQRMIATREQLQQIFQQLHGQLQRRESELLQELGDIFNKEIEPIDKARLSVREHIVKIGSTLKDTETVMNNQQFLVVNAQMVLARLKSIQQTLCCVQYVHSEEQPIRFELDESVGGLLETAVTIDAKSFGRLESLTMKDAPDDFFDDDQRSASPSSSHTSLSHNTLWQEQSSEADSADTTDVLSTLMEASHSLKQKKSKKKGYRKLWIEKDQEISVIVTHVKHPCSFTVQRIKDQSELLKLSAKLQRHCQQSNDLPEDVSEECPVLAQFSSDQQWYRAEVRGVVVTADDGDPTVSKVEVVYVDYGNMEVLPLSQLRRITPQFLRLPALALTAGLIDIVSSDPSGQWILDAVKGFAEMTNEKPMLMHTVELVRPGQVLVDLCKPMGDDGVDDRPVSVRDALVFLEYAILVPNPGTLRPPPRPQRRFIAPALPIKGVTFQCVLSHVESPYCFYVQRAAEESRHLIDLMETLQKVYDATNKNLWSVFYPQLDLVCVAEYPDDRKWYRAQVVGIPGRCNIDVHYVDFGNKARVSYTQLRCIQPSFLTLAKQALPCSLADVLPMEGAGWSTESIARLETLYGMELTAVVTEIQDRQLSLQLFTLDGMCINEQLVTEQLAISTGPNSQKPVVMKHQSEMQKDKSKDKSKVIAQVKQPAQPVAQPPSGDISNLFVVTHIKDPSHLYVQPASADKDGLASMMSELQQRLANPDETCHEWNVDDHVAVKKDQDGLWYRGMITGRGSDSESFMVKFLDYGNSVSALAAGLQPLPQEGPFLAHAFVLRCHLSGVQPAGHSTKWSKTAIEYLKNITDNKLVSIEPKGKRENNSQPVDLVYQEKVEGDALSPDKLIQRSITEMLLNQGVALPNRRLTSSGRTVTVEPKAKVIGGDMAEGSNETSSKDTVTKDIASVVKGDGDMLRSPPVEKSETADVEQTGVVCDTPTEEGVLPTVEGEALTGKAVVLAKEGVAPSKAGTEIAGGASSEHVEQLTYHMESVSITDKQTPPADPTQTPADPAQTPAGGDKGATSHTTQTTDPGCDLSSTKRVIQVLAPSNNCDFAPPVLPDHGTVKVVPTYVDMDMNIYVQEVKQDEDMEGRFGYFLKEHTLETIIQDKYLAEQGLHRARIPRDGNCLFRSCAQIIYGDQGYQVDVRNTAVKHLEFNWHAIQDTIGEQDREKYLHHMRQDKCYGGEPEIRAICETFNVSVELIMGGLSYPVHLQHYKPTASDTMMNIRLVYISDGNVDNGHYDLAVETMIDLAQIEAVYQLYRTKKIAELKEWPMYHNDSEYDDSLLDQLSGYINDQYRDSDPDPAANWLVGQSVIAKFTLDDTFYRAKIISINNQGIKVQYIDFGNSEYVGADRLRADVILTDIPQQCYRCVLHGTEPIKDKTLLDVMHQLCVNKECTIHIIKHQEQGEPVSVTLQLPDGRDLATVMQMEMAPVEPKLTSVPGEDEFGVGCSQTGYTGESTQLPANSNSNNIMDNMPDSMHTPYRQAPSPYSQLEGPMVGAEETVLVYQAESPSIVYISPASLLQPLAELDERLNADANNLKPISYVKPGMACCGQYTLDSRWYRGEVLTVVRDGGKTMAGVLFVDYGNFEWINSDNICQLPSEYLVQSAMSCQCHLVGLIPAEGDEWSPAAQQMARQTYINQFLLARYTSVAPVIEVELYVVPQVDDTSMVPVANVLVEAGLARWSGQAMEDGTIVEDAESSSGDEEELTDAAALAHRLAETELD